MASCKALGWNRPSCARGSERDDVLLLQAAIESGPVVEVRLRSFAKLWARFSAKTSSLTMSHASWITFACEDSCRSALIQHTVLGKRYRGRRTCYTSGHEPHILIVPLTPATQYACVDANVIPDRQVFRFHHYGKYQQCLTASSDDHRLRLLAFALFAFDRLSLPENCMPTSEQGIVARLILLRDTIIVATARVSQWILSLLSAAPDLTGLDCKILLKPFRAGLERSVLEGIVVPSPNRKVDQELPHG